MTKGWTRQVSRVLGTREMHRTRGHPHLIIPHHLHLRVEVLLMMLLVLLMLLLMLLMLMLLMLLLMLMLLMLVPKHVDALSNFTNWKQSFQLHL